MLSDDSDVRIATDSNIKKAKIVAVFPETFARFPACFDGEFHSLGHSTFCRGFAAGARAPPAGKEMNT